jgi:hypothetical protein
VPTATDRTTEPTALRVTLSTGAATGTVPVGPSVLRNAEGARLPTGPRSCSRWVTEAVRRDSEVTAVPSAYPHALLQQYRHAESRHEVAR